MNEKEFLSSFESSENDNSEIENIDNRIINYKRLHKKNFKLSNNNNLYLQLKKVYEKDNSKFNDENEEEVDNNPTLDILLIEDLQKIIEKPKSNNNNNLVNPGNKRELIEKKNSGWMDLYLKMFRRKSYSLIEIFLRTLFFCRYPNIDKFVDNYYPIISIPVSKVNNAIGSNNYLSIAKNEEEVLSLNANNNQNKANNKETNKEEFFVNYLLKSVQFKDKFINNNNTYKPKLNKNMHLYKTVFSNKTDTFGGHLKSNISKRISNLTLGKYFSNLVLGSINKVNLHSSDINVLSLKQKNKTTIATGSFKEINPIKHSRKNTNNNNQNTSNKNNQILSSFNNKSNEGKSSQVNKENTAKIVKEFDSNRMNKKVSNINSSKIKAIDTTSAGLNKEFNSIDDNSKSNFAYQAINSTGSINSNSNSNYFNFNSSNNTNQENSTKFKMDNRLVINTISNLDLSHSGVENNTTNKKNKGTDLKSFLVNSHNKINPNMNNINTSINNCVTNVHKRNKVKLDKNKPRPSTTKNSNLNLHKNNEILDLSQSQNKSKNFFNFKSSIISNKVNKNKMKNDDSKVYLLKSSIKSTHNQNSQRCPRILQKNIDSVFYEDDVSVDLEDKSDIMQTQKNYYDKNFVGINNNYGNYCKNKIKKTVNYRNKNTANLSDNKISSSNNKNIMSTNLTTKVDTLGSIASNNLIHNEIQIQPLKKALSNKYITNDTSPRIPKDRLVNKNPKSSSSNKLVNYFRSMNINANKENEDKDNEEAMRFVNSEVEMKFFQKLLNNKANKVNKTSQFLNEILFDVVKQDYEKTKYNTVYTDSIEEFFNSSIKIKDPVCKSYFKLIIIA